MNSFESIAENLVVQENFTRITLTSGEEQENNTLALQGQRVRLMINSEVLLRFQDTYCARA